MPSHPREDVLLVEVTRSGCCESRHRGVVAICHDGETVFTAGDVATPVFCRSAVKPLQALPFLERGLGERLALTDGEVAVMCASHGGSAVHTAAVRRFLAHGGLDEEQLGCGPHPPLDSEARLQLLRQGQAPGRVHNNCSGKHTGFLYLAQLLGDDLGGYLDPGSRGQGEVNAAVAAMAGVSAPVPVGVDGCGAPTFLLPPLALARAFSRFANPADLPAVRSAACRRIFEAIGREPVLLAGEGRFCTALARSLPGRVLGKVGAEGIYAVALAPDPGRRRWPGGVGIAVKVSDGAERAVPPVVVEVLRRLGCWGGDVPESLRAWHRAGLANTRQEPTGEVACVLAEPAP
jgi:L-asparaginase II